MPKKAALVSVVSLAVLLLGQGLAYATPGGPGVAPPFPATGQYSNRAAPPLTGRDLQFMQAKERLARAHWALRQRHLAAALATGATPASALYSSRNLAVAYQAQINYYYCGPATTAMIAGYLRVGWPGTAAQQQGAAAYLLATTSGNGTAWTGSDRVKPYPYWSWYVVADTLDYQIWHATGNSWYAGLTVPASPTSGDNYYYVQNLTYDIDESHPLAFNQYSIAGYQFYYQSSQFWAHWLVGRGYSSSGSYTIVNDPGFSAGNNASLPSVGIRGSVLEAVGQHGYIW